MWSKPRPQHHPHCFAAFPDNFGPWFFRVAPSGGGVEQACGQSWRGSTRTHAGALHCAGSCGRTVLTSEWRSCGTGGSSGAWKLHGGRSCGGWGYWSGWSASRSMDTRTAGVLTGNAWLNPALKKTLVRTAHTPLVPLRRTWIPPLPRTRQQVHVHLYVSWLPFPLPHWTLPHQSVQDLHQSQSLLLVPLQACIQCGWYRLRDADWKGNQPQSLLQNCPSSHQGSGTAKPPDSYPRACDPWKCIASCV